MITSSQGNRNGIEGATDTFTLSTTPTAIIASRTTKRITIGEDGSVVGWPTVDFKIRKPLSSSEPIQKTLGLTYVFERDRPYVKGEIAGYAEVAAGSTTFFQDDSGV